MLKSIELSGFKSFARKTSMDFPAPICAIVGPNGSGKSNTAEAFRFALGEQSMKSLRGSRSEDLLFNGSHKTPRANRAHVRVTLDNSKQLLKVGFNEVGIERVIHRDSTHQYLINDSQVRLKDVLEVLAGANIGPTGHHIISQGEADRILSLKPLDRRLMIEDALGLKLYHLKKKESERKLSRTDENLAEIRELERSVAPELRLLERRMKKIRKAQEIKKELLDVCVRFFASEEKAIQVNQDELKEQEQEEKQRLASLQNELSAIRAYSESAPEADKNVHPHTELIRACTDREQDIQGQIQELQRRIGSVETELRLLKEPRESEEKHILWDDFVELKDSIFEALRSGETITDVYEAVKDALEAFTDTYQDKEDTSRVEERIEELRAVLDGYEDELSKRRKELEDVHRERMRLEDERSRAEQKTHRGEREEKILELAGEIRDCERTIASTIHAQEQLRARLVELKENIGRIGTIVGRDVYTYKDHMSDARVMDRSERTEAERRIERLVARYEDCNIGSAREIEREYKEMKDRHEFLLKEINDLTQSKKSLSDIIRNIEEELGEKFKKGLENINKQFDTFFQIMFGGGSASLVLKDCSREDEEEGVQTLGVDIDVALPRKRIQGLTMLSGGERSLVAIALVFAMSQINPPPFLILDETDAALDESNSRKYGDMIEELSKHSQLVLITHNRETMARANILYGVTMGSDGVSRLLSINFDDAEAMAAR